MKQDTTVGIIEMDEIRKLVARKHKSFIKNCMSQSSRDIADRTLMAEKVLGKIYIICGFMKDNGIVDSCEVLHDGKFKRVVIQKWNFEAEVEIATNGITIVIFSKNFYQHYGYGALNPYVNFNVTDSKFSWKEFAEELQKYIYLTIYEMKESWLDIET